MFREILRDPLHFLIVADWTFVVVIWVVGLRLAFIRAGERAEQHRRLTLGRPLPRELSKEYHAHHRQLMWLMVAFMVVLAAGIWLLWLKISF